MSTPEDIQAEIDGKHRLLAREHNYRNMWAVLAATHLAVLFLPWAPVVFLGVGLFMWLLCGAESLRLVREISALAKRRKVIEEQVDTIAEHLLGEQK